MPAFEEPSSPTYGKMDAMGVVHRFGWLLLVAPAACIPAADDERSPSSDPGVASATSDKADTPLTTSISAGHDGGPTSISAGADPGSTDCCDEHDAAGCGDVIIEACVCEVDRSCCTTRWDTACVAIADARCDAACEGPETGGSSTGTLPDETPASSEPCCFAHESTGCDTPAVEACVCDADPFCCTTQWDNSCILLAAQCGGGCASCCVANDGPSCGEGDIRSCVCGLEASCCEDAWTDACAATAEASCGADCSNLDCCTVHSTPACSDPQVEACVCALDPYCCTIEWDSFCAASAQSDCAASCGETVG